MSSGKRRKKPEKTSPGVSIVLESRFFNAYVGYLMPFVKDTGVLMNISSDRMEIRTFDAAHITLLHLTLYYEDVLHHEILNADDSNVEFTVGLPLSSWAKVCKISTPRNPHVRLLFHQDEDKSTIEFGDYVRAGGGRNAAFNVKHEYNICNMDLKTDLIGIPQYEPMIAFSIDSAIMRSEVTPWARVADDFQFIFEGDTREVHESKEQAKEREARAKMTGKKTAPPPSRRVFVPTKLLFRRKDKDNGTEANTNMSLILSYQTRAAKVISDVIDTEPAWKAGALVEFDPDPKADENDDEITKCKRKDLSRIVGIDDRLAALSIEPATPTSSIGGSVAEEQEDEDDAPVKQQPRADEEEEEEDDDDDAPVRPKQEESRSNGHKKIKRDTEEKPIAKKTAGSASKAFGLTVDLEVFDHDAEDPPETVAYAPAILCNITAGTVFSRQATIEIFDQGIMRARYRTGKKSFIHTYLAPKCIEGE